MIRCPQCGEMNEPGSKFCADCGSDLRHLVGTSVSTPPQIGAPTSPFGNSPVVRPESGRGSSRPWYFWVLLVIGLFILVCCVLSILAGTVFDGQVTEFATWASDWQTKNP